MIEAQSRYISTLVRQVLLAQENGRQLALRPDSGAFESFNDQLQAVLREGSFGDPNCNSWYKTDDGLITNNWSGTAVEYQEALSTVRWHDYIAEGSGRALVDKKTATNIGRVKEESSSGATPRLLVAASVLAVLGSYYTKGSVLLR